MANILIIEDSPAQRAEIRQALEESQICSRILEAGDGLEGLKCLLNEPVDAVLCDLQMPSMGGEKLLQVRASQGIRGDIPFLFVSATSDPAQRVRLLEGGASDVVTKPYHAGELVARLRLHLNLKRLQTELRDKNEMLARVSTTDAVTGLRTRRYVSEVLHIEWIRARRYRTPLSVMMLDLDHFKRVNDVYGHQAGDLVLRGVSEIVDHELRACDVAGRYGGEELIAVLPQTPLGGAVPLGERCRQAIEAARFRTADGQEIQVTVSIGISAATAAHRVPDDLVAEADAALYRAKDSGRNRIEFAEAEPATSEAAANASP